MFVDQWLNDIDSDFNNMKEKKIDFDRIGVKTPVSFLPRTLKIV